MARIRTIKPEHWEDENWDNVSLQAHLLFLGMKNFADDKGVIKDNAILIKNKVFPTREDIRTSDVVKWLNELVNNAFLVPLTYNDKGYYVLDFASERIDKPQPSILPKEAFLQIKKDHSVIFSNTPAVEEMKGIGEVEEKESNYARDFDFENSVLSFWGYNETNHFQNFKKISECCAAIFSRNQLDHFKNQFKFYSAYIPLIGMTYKHSFAKYLGDQSECFENGVWNSENWEQKLIEQKKHGNNNQKRTGGLNPNTTTGATPATGYGQL